MAFIETIANVASSSSKALVFSKGKVLAKDFTIAAPSAVQSPKPWVFFSGEVCAVPWQQQHLGHHSPFAAVTAAS
jgi:hypothetical protein